MADPIIVDNSILTAVAACDTQAALRYVLGLTMAEDRAPLMAGHTVHAILAAHLRGEPAEAWCKLSELVEYATFAQELPEGDRLSYDNVMAVMGQWCATHPLSTLPYTVDPKLVEVGFAVPLDTDIIFVGRMDALVQDANGAWYVLEHKSTGQLGERWRRRFKTSAQITGYVWAAQQFLQLPVAGCFVNGIELSKLPSDPKRKCRDHGVPYAECGVQHTKFDLLIEHRAPHQTAQWLDTARRLARKYKHLLLTIPDVEALNAAQMSGMFNGSCELCQFAPFCATGRLSGVAENLLRRDPWSPYEHAFQALDSH